MNIQTLLSLGLDGRDVVFLVLLLAFSFVLAVLAYQQALNHYIWFAYPLVVLLAIWIAIYFLEWRNSVITLAGLPMLAAGIVGIHLWQLSVNSSKTRTESAQRILKEVDPNREVSREVWGLAERVVNGSKAEGIASSRTLASMSHAVTELERAFLLRLMTWLLVKQPAWRLQAARNVILAIKTSRMASTTGRFVDMAYRSDQKFMREFLTRFFNLEELKSLCADMGIDYDTLPGDGKEAKARELVDHCYRHERLGELLGLCREKHPTKFSEFPIGQSASEVPATRLQDSSYSNKMPLPSNVVAQLSSHVYAITCVFCQGKGYNPSRTSEWKIIEYSPDVCTICKGKGILRVETNDVILTHAACHGTGLQKASCYARYRFFQSVASCFGCGGLGVCSLSGELKIIS